jgi:hypothetical protein
MNAARRFLLACLAALALAGCATNSLPPALPGVSAGTRSVMRTTAHRSCVTVTIKVPRRERRGPRYVSPATRSIAIAVYDASHVKQVASSQVNLTPGTTQTISVALAPASYSFDATTYDQTGEKGNVLSRETGFPFTVDAGKANAIPIVLDGVPASVQILPGNGSIFLDGNQTNGFQLAGVAPQAVEVFARDADDNVILGPGAPSVRLGSNGASVTVTLAGVAHPNRFVLTRANQTEGSVTLTATATPATGTAVTSNATLKTVQLVYLYVPGAVEAFAPWSTSPVLTITTGLSGKMTRSPYYEQNRLLAFDSSGNLYVVDAPSNDLVVYAPGSAVPSRTISNGVSTPSAIALDAQDELYVVNYNDVTEYAAGSSTVSTTYTTGLSYPADIAIDTARGWMYVESYVNNSIIVYALGDNVPARTITSGIGYPYGIALDAGGTLYVGNADNNSTDNQVTTYAVGTSTIAHTFDLGPNTLLTAAYQGGVAVDSAGTLCVALTTYAYCGNASQGLVSTISGFPFLLNHAYAPAMTFDSVGRLYVAMSQPSPDEFLEFPPFDGTFPITPVPMSALPGSALDFSIAVQP